MIMTDKIKPALHVNGNIVADVLDCASPKMGGV